MRHGDERKPSLTALLLIAALFWTSGCTFDESGHAPVTRTWTCTVPVTECTYDLLPTATQVHSGPLRARISYTPFVVGEVGPYFDSGAVFQNIDTVPEAHILNGALLVQTRQTDHDASSYSFSLEIDDKVSAVWLFYDERCEAPPSWITSDVFYGGNSGPSDAPHARVTLSGPGPGQDFGEQATFRGWKLNQPVQNLPAGQTAFLDFHSNLGCSDPGSTPNAMYFLAVVTAPDVNQTCLSTDTLTNEFIVEVPSSSVAWEAEEEALRTCEASAEPYESCPEPNQGLVVCEASAENNNIVTQQFPLTTRHFAVSSEGEFTPNPGNSPQLRITANGRTGTTNDLSGAIYFDYDPLSGDAVIQEISLALDHMMAGDYDLRDLRIISLDRMETICKDAKTPVAALCRDYEIQKNSAGFLIATDVDNKRMLFASQNSADSAFAVDVNSRTFAYSGSQTSTSLVVNGKTIPLSIDLDLRGSFVNINPITSIKETDQTVECGHQVGSADGGFVWVERGNHYPVNLDAWGTTDLENSAGLDFEWFENHRTPVQRHLGSGSLVTVPEHVWPYGVHRLTLVVSEEWSSPNAPPGFAPLYRTSSFHHFDMEVTDTTPPTIIAAPLDRTVVIAPGSRGVVVDIGQMKAEDSCSPSVSITNDAPAGHYFVTGSHTVTWLIDDNRGNPIEYEQYIRVETEELPERKRLPIGRFPSEK